MHIFSSLRRRLLNKHQWWRVFAVGGIFLLLLGLSAFPGYVLAEETVSVPEAYFANFVIGVANLITYLTNALGSLLIVVIEMLVMPILQYNSFSESHVIGLGWALVRNVVNMFVVVILMVIAVLTIVGDKRVNWQQNIPNLLIAVILVNFSRTICGLFIDISQVVMFTFVNALLDIAAGNFAGLLGLNNFGQYSIPNLQADGISAAEQLGAAYLQFILYAAIAVIMVLLAIAFIWRIVTLWILVIMSPLAFFLGGIKSIFGAAAGAQSQWWSRFSAALMMGPLLTFFLWLSLAAASTGAIATSEYFPLPTDPSAATLRSFQTDHLLSVMLGLVLLVVGMQQAASAASSLGGAASWAINEKMGKRVIGDIARYSGLGAARGAGRAVGYTGARVGAEGARLATGNIMKAGAALGSIPLIGGVAGRAVVDAAGSAQQRIESFQKAGSKAAKERISRMTDDQKAANLQILAAGRTGALNINTRDDIAAMQTEVATNAGVRKTNAQRLDTATNRNLNITAMRHADAVKDGLDGGQKDNLMKFKSEQAHLLEEALGKGSLAKHIDSEKFNPRDLSGDAVQSSEVLEALKKKVVRTRDDGTTINAYDELMRGAYGADLAKKARSGGAPSIEQLASLREPVVDAEGTVKEPARPYTAKEIENGLRGEKLKPSAIPDSAFSGPNRDNLVRAVIDANAVKDLSDATRQAMADALENMPPDKISIEDRAKADRMMLEKGDDPTLLGLVPLNATVGPVTLPPRDALRVEQIIKQDPAAARHFASGIAPGNWNGVTKIVTDQLGSDDIKELARRAQKADETEKQQIRDALKVINDALDSEIISGRHAPARVTEMNKVRRDVGQAQRYVI